MYIAWDELGALCINVEPEYFFGDAPKSFLKDEKIEEFVVDLCNKCPVQTECLNYCVVMKCTGVFGGVWLKNGKKELNKEKILKEEEW